MDKKDLEEIEKWKKQKMNYVETYGVDYGIPETVEPFDLTSLYSQYLY